MLLGAGDGHCQESAPEPYELMRSLRAIQDGIARGDNAAFLSYKTSLTRITQQFGKAPAEAWKDPRNVRAAVALVLSGGDPHVLEPLVAQVTGRSRRSSAPPWHTARTATTKPRSCSPTSMRARSTPSVAGHVALVQAELVARTEREKSWRCLDEARLLAPGTMIEEAALRREVALAVELSDADLFESSTKQYMRRFANSVHMGNFRRQLAIDLATRGLADEPARRARLEATLETLAASQRQDVYLSVAWEGLKGSSVDLVLWAASKAAAVAGENSASNLRSKLCEAAVLIVTDEFDKGLSVLESIPAENLSDEETALLFAALRVARQVRRDVKPTATDTGPPRGATEPQIVASARSAIARVDDLLGGGRK